MNDAHKVTKIREGKYRYRRYTIENIAHRHGVVRYSWRVGNPGGPTFETLKAAIAYIDGL